VHTTTIAERPMPSLDGERLLSRAEVCDRVGKTFATIWAWMQAGKFPRARCNNPGGQPQWLESEITAWMRALPVKPYKGDAEVMPAIESEPEPNAESKRRALAEARRENVRVRTRRRQKAA
jgi:predicted DNA-binding transcriptional regulator AlpA